MNYFTNKHNLFFRICAVFLIILHIFTFGPMCEVFAFSAQSTSYRLNSGTVNEGSGNRTGTTIKVSSDSIGEPCIGKSQSTSYILISGVIPVIQSDPPQLTQNIPFQRWQKNSAKSNAFDLGNYFFSPQGHPLTYSVMGNSNINVAIDSSTHQVSFTQPQGWSGIETVYFTATDSEFNSTKSNKVVLLVEDPAGSDKPVILDAQVSPSIIQEGDLVTLTVKAMDVDGEDVNFNYNSFFTEIRKWKEGDFWYSEATWQTTSNSKGHYNIAVTVTDPTNLSDTENIIVNVGNFNHPPVFDAIPDISANEGDLVFITPHATDSDNDPITFYYQKPFDTQGKWLTGYEDAGVHTIIVIASDGIDTVSRQAKIIVNNTNRAPIASLSLNQYTVEPNTQITINLSASDPDNDSMTFSIQKDTQEIASGAITNSYSTTTAFTNEGYYKITAKVRDSSGLETIVTKDLQVTTRKPAQPVMGDFNGDCLTDLGMHDSSTGLWEVCLSNGGVFESASSWLTNFGATRDWSPVGGDFNGDGKTDIGVYNASTGELKIALSTGSSFNASGIWLVFPSASVAWQIVSGNFNGDKYSDAAFYNKDTGEIRVYLGTGTGFGSCSTWMSNAGTGYVAMGGDFNGDSLTDLCLVNKSAGEYKVAFSDTTAFVDCSVWLTGFATGKDVFLSDFNNDGLSDIGYWDKSDYKWYYAISNGSKFITKGLWVESFGESKDDCATTGDFNGDGIIDAAVFDADGLGINRWQVQLSTNKQADLMTEIDNGIGGKTTITYTYAAKSDNSGLPFPVYVASSISSINTLPLDRPQEVYTQNFNFSGGYFDAVEREFRGFAKVKITDPITGNYSETYFYQGRPGQDGALKGQIEKVFAYDGNDRLISQTLNTYEVRKAGPADNVLGFPFVKENTTTVWEENGNNIVTTDKFVYDNIGNLLEARSEGDLSVAGDEKITETVYSQAYDRGFNRPVEVSLKDKDGNVINKKNFEYDSHGNLLKEKIVILNPLTMGNELATVDYSYDSFGNITSSTDALGRIVTTEYETDFYAFPIRTINALGHTMQYVYEPKFGVVLSVTDTNGQTSTTEYDTFGRVTNVRNANNEIVTSYSYPDFNTKITSQLNLQTKEYIDGLGRKYKTVKSGEDGTSSRDVVSEVFFNNRGQTEKESIPHYAGDDEANIAYVKYEYDIRGRLKKTISDFPGTAKDAEIRIDYIEPLYTEITDALGHKKGTKKDVFGNITEITEFTSDGVFHTKYEYDLQNNLVKVVDNQGNISRLFYDSAGRKIKMIDPDMGVWTYEYDIVGNLLRQTDAKGQVLEFSYDSLNRLTAKRNTLNANPLVEYYYDDTNSANRVGRLYKVIDQSGSTEFFYDNLGREVKSIKTVGGIPYTVERTYDLLGRLTSLKYPDGEVVNYAYDVNSGSLEKVTGAQTYVQDITYNAKGQIKVITYGNNTQTAYTYGQDLRLSQILTQNAGSAILQNLNYDFDKNGNLATLVDNLRSNIRTYTYDSLDRLTEAHNVPASGGGYSNYYYQYDSIGNMIYKSDVGQMTYGQNAGPHALTSASGYSYQYDANGNMIFGKNKTMVYDAENRLISSDNGQATENYLYDGDGGRVKKSIVSGQQSAETVYIGSLYEVESEGKITKHIFAGPNRVCSIKKDAAQGGLTDSYYYHSDHLGSSNIITNANGTQVQYCEYTPYGTLARNEGTDIVSHKFTGKELDSTGLYFYGARYYDPEIGRFITADTIVQAPYNPQTLNRYTYCGNNPINYVDPSGHFWFLAPIIAAIIGAGVGATVAAVIGGDIGKGALFGAISGAIFWGAGQTIAILAKAMSIPANSAAMAGLSAGVHTLAGGASGALGALATGGDVGGNAAIGGISAGVSSIVGSAFPIEGDGFGAVAARGAQRTLVGTILGGGTSLVMGGSFGEGAAQGAMTSAIGYTTNCVGAITIPIVELAFLGLAAVALNNPQARANFQRVFDSLTVHFGHGKNSPQNQPTGQREIDKYKRGWEKSDRYMNLQQVPPNQNEPPDMDPKNYNTKIGTILIAAARLFNQAYDFFHRY